MKARALHVVLSLDPGGTERLVLDLAQRLHDEIPTAICCLDRPGAWAAEAEARGIAVTALQRREGFQPMLGGAIAKAARRHRATILHAHHYSPFVYSCLARLWSPSLQVVFTEHGRLSDAPPSVRRRLANRVLAKVPRAVIAVSEDMKHHIVREGFAPNAVGVIYNGIDVGPCPSAATRQQIREELGVADGTLVIGTIARLDPVKDLRILVRATADVANEWPVCTIVIGDGPERRNLEAQASSLEMQRAIRFLGYRDDARDWLAGCDVYVNSSISEGVSLTILEAMAARLAIVATRVGGTPEVVDETCGRLIPSRDSGRLAAALLELARAPGTRADLGRAARERVETRFTLERMVRQYRDVYSGVHRGSA